MQRTHLASSVIAGVAYDEGKSILEVTFRSGRVYRYFEVPVTMHQELLAAPSAGSYFNREIRDHYRSEEIAQRSRA